MKKNGLEIKYIVLIVLLVITIFLGIFSFVVKDNRKLSPIEEVIKDVVVTTQKVVYAPFNYLNNKIIKYNEMNNLYNEYKIVKKELDKIDLVNSQNAELKRELSELKKLLKIDKSLTEYNYLNATIINRNTAYWYNTITIDKGFYNGIRDNMAVISSKGLIGKVIKTTNFTSEVKMITTNDINNKISVGIDINGTIIHGLIAGYDYKTNNLIVEGIVEMVDIPATTAVYTTGLGETFPSGILIGNVVSVKKDEYDLAKKILIKPTVDFNNIRFVTVLNRKDNRK
jgi:rod shape-determining protein MreC